MASGEGDRGGWGGGEVGKTGSRTLLHDSPGTNSETQNCFLAVNTLSLGVLHNEPSSRDGCQERTSEGGVPSSACCSSLGSPSLRASSRARRGWPAIRASCTEDDCLQYNPPFCSLQINTHFLEFPNLGYSVEVTVPPPLPPARMCQSSSEQVIRRRA